MAKSSDEMPPFEGSSGKGKESNNDASSDERRFHYSEQEAEALKEKLANDDTFNEATHILVTWMNRGECNERTCAKFYELMEIIFNRIEKLKAEKKEFFMEYRRSQRRLSHENDSMRLELNEIEKIFESLDSKSTWDNFTADQVTSMQQLREEIFDLKQHISRNERANAVSLQNIRLELEAKLDRLSQEEELLKKEMEYRMAEVEKSNEEIRRLREEIEERKAIMNAASQSSCDQASQSHLDEARQKEMHLLTLVSIFLFDQANGVNIHGIYSYVLEHIPTIQVAEIESTLRGHPQVFKESVSSHDSEESKWTCIAINQKKMEKILKKLKNT